MKFRVTLSLGAAATVLLSTVIGAAPAEAAKPSWLAIRTPTKTTAYNGGKAAVTARATAHGQRVITTIKMTAYSGRKRVASAKTVRLRPGKYRTVTSGTYRTYRLVSQQRTRKILHAGGFVAAACRVTKAVDQGNGFTDSTATCRNGYYPKQRRQDVKFDTYQIGDTYSEYFDFNDEYVSQHYTARVRSYGKTQRFSSAKRNLTVRNGGFRRSFHGTGSLDTRNFRVPRGNWRLSYRFSCSDWTNFIVWIHRPNGEYVDLAANDLDYSGSGSVREHGAGKYYLEIDTECSWRITIR